MLAAIKNDLRKSHIFRDFDDTELEKIVSIASIRKFKKNSMIFYERDQANNFYIIKSGRVKIFRPATDGREFILGIFSSGALFGDVPVFDGGSYPATAQSIDDCEVYAISKEGFESFIIKNPLTSIKIIKTLSRRLRNALNQVSDLAMKNVSQRLAGMLVKFAEQEGIVDDSGIYLECDLTRQELAELIGVSRETFTRELGKFAKAGILRCEKRNILITNIDKLKIWSL